MARERERGPLDRSLRSLRAENENDRRCSFSFSFSNAASHAVASLLIVAALLVLAGPARAEDAPAAPSATGVVRGRVVLDIDGVRLGDLGPTVVFLGPLEGARLSYPTPTAEPKIRQHDAQFSPSFLVIPAGTTVEMPNDDAIVHNVFSYSKPNEFDLGTYPRNTSRSKTFLYPGLVRVYCSLHASMNATIFVAPSPWFARAAPDGGFAISGVPPGRYLLETWNDRLARAIISVEARAGETTVADLTIR